MRGVVSDPSEVLTEQFPDAFPWASSFFGEAQDIPLEDFSDDDEPRRRRRRRRSAEVTETPLPPHQDSPTVLNNFLESDIARPTDQIGSLSRILNNYKTPPHNITFSLPITNVERINVIRAHGVEYNFFTRKMNRHHIGVDLAMDEHSLNTRGGLQPEILNIETGIIIDIFKFPVERDSKGEGCFKEPGVYIKILHNVTIPNADPEQFVSFYSHLDENDWIIKAWSKKFYDLNPNHEPKHLEDCDVTPSCDSIIVPFGATIGIAGNSGRSAKPHLHFSLRRKNLSGEYVFVNPLEYFRT